MAPTTDQLRCLLGANIMSKSSPSQAFPTQQLKRPRIFWSMLLCEACPSTCPTGQNVTKVTSVFDSINSQNLPLFVKHLSLFQIHMSPKLAFGILVSSYITWHSLLENFLHIITLECCLHIQSNVLKRRNFMPLIQEARQFPVWMAK